MRALLRLGVTDGVLRHKSNRSQDSATGTRTRVARVRAEYPNQLDYSGFCTRGSRSSFYSTEPHRRRAQLRDGAMANAAPPVGLEPTIFGLEVRRLVH